MPKLSEQTALVVKARHSGNMFNEMGEKNLLLSAQLILADLKLLSGLKIPTGDAFERMTDLFAESLKQDYPFYTVPLVQIAIKKHINVLTTGKEKSYGRDLSIADFHQIMNEYSLEIQTANKEVDELLIKHADEKKLSEDEQQNIIRAAIQKQYESGNYECTYAVFNQLLRDKIITADSLNKQGWKAVQKLKEKFLIIIQSIPAKDNPESIRFSIERKNVVEKYELICQIEDEVKGEVASLYLQWASENNVQKVYQQV